MDDKKTILIKNAVIYTMDDENTVYKNGNIIIENDKIRYIGNEEHNENTYDNVIDGKNKIVMPGLINCHTHVGMTVLRGYANDMPLWDWLSKKIWPIEDKLTAEDIYYASLLSIMEMLKCGVTTFSDMYMFMDDVANAVCKSGMRAVLARGLQGPDDKSDNRLYEAKELYKNYNGAASGRITVMVGPHAEYTCSEEYLIKCIELAEELNTGMHIHVSETKKETNECIGRHGRTPVKFLYDIGMMNVPVTAAHCVALNDQDKEIIEQNSVHVIHNPSSNLKLASGIAPIAELIDNGVNVCLGTDSAASNNDLDIWKEMRLTALIHKAEMNNPSVVTAIEALRMATTNGARALRLDKYTGCLEHGKKADLIMLDMDTPHFYPRLDLLNNIVYSADSSDVCLTMVDGKILYENGEFTTIDKDIVYSKINGITERLFAKEGFQNV